MVLGHESAARAEHRERHALRVAAPSSRVAPVDDVRTWRRGPWRVLDAPVPGHVWRLRFGVSGYPSGGFAVSVTGDRQSFALNAAGESLTVADNSGAVFLAMPASASDAADVDIVVDADILEITVTGTEGIASTRIPVVGSGDIRISSRGGSSITGASLATHP